MIVTRNPAALYAYDNGRAVGTFLNPNELAAYLLVVLGLAAGVVLLRAQPAAAGLGRRHAGRGSARARRNLLALGFLLGRRRRRVLRAARRRPAHLDRARDRRGGWRCCSSRVRAREHHNPRDDTSRIVAWTTGVRTWLAFPAHRRRAVRVPAHLRGAASARGAGRRSAGGLRSAQPAAGVSRRDRAWSVSPR